MTINLRTREGYADLKRILDGRPDDVLSLCRIDLPKSNGTRRTLSVIDDPAGSGHGNFALWFKSDGLSWKNYTTDEKGRSLELIAYCRGWYHLDKRGGPEAARFAVERLGLGRVSSEEIERDRAAAQQRQVQQRAQADADLARQQGAAFKLFMEAIPILGTQAETYWREGRGVDLRAEPFIGPRGGSLVPHCLRFVPRHKYVHRDRDGRKVGESWHPCQIAACVDADMKIRAVHQTWLRDDGRDKLQLAPAPDGAPQKPRKVFPSSRGLVIPLWRGEGHLSLGDAIKNGVVETGTLVEGNEDGLSAVKANPKNRTWAMISLSNFRNVVERLPANWDAVIVHRQNDWLKSAAVAAFDDGMAAVRATGRMVAEVAAVRGKDLNDTLRGE